MVGEKGQLTAESRISYMGSVFEEVDEKYSWVEGPYDHYARTIQTAIEGYADCVLATDPGPEEFDTYAGVLEARATSEPPIDSDQFWRELDNPEERQSLLARPQCLRWREKRP